MVPENDETLILTFRARSQLAQVTLSLATLLMMLQGQAGEDWSLYIIRRLPPAFHISCPGIDWLIGPVAPRSHLHPILIGRSNPGVRWPGLPHAHSP